MDNCVFIARSPLGCNWMELWGSLWSITQILYTVYIFFKQLVIVDNMKPVCTFIHVLSVWPRPSDSVPAVSTYWQNSLRYSGIPGSWRSVHWWGNALYPLHKKWIESERQWPHHWFCFLSCNCIQLYQKLMTWTKTCLPVQLRLLLAIKSSLGTCTEILHSSVCKIHKKIL